jgi:RimJ/RimL family protein N-acetyltransferase
MAINLPPAALERLKSEFADCLCESCLTSYIQAEDADGGLPLLYRSASTHFQSITMLATPRLLIRPFRNGDWRDLHEYLSLPQTYLFEPGEPISESQARALAAERARSTGFLAVESKNEGKMIGHLYFNQVEPKDFLTWELGYIFNPRYQGMGYCTEACASLLEHGFRRLNAHRIVAYCNPLNPASWRVLDKIGMRREGLFNKKAFFHKDEKGNPLWHDCLAYGLLEEEYPSPGI